jgi:hypothetical protein
MSVQERMGLNRWRLIIVLGVLVVGLAVITSSTALAQAGGPTTDLTTLDAGDAAAYRWQAMGRYYMGQPPTTDLTTLSADQVSAYRWQAMARYYAGQTATTDLRTLNAGDALAYRWLAMAQYYGN